MKKHFLSISCGETSELDKLTKIAPIEGELHINIDGGYLDIAILTGAFLKAQTNCTFYIYNVFSAGVIPFLMIPRNKIKLFNKAIIHFHQPILADIKDGSILQFEQRLQQTVTNREAQIAIARDSDHPDDFKKEYYEFLHNKVHDTFLFAGSNAGKNFSLIRYGKFGDEDDK